MIIHGKNINLFLMDGTVNGRIKCTLANWTGVVYKIPRIMLDQCKERLHLKQSGIYFLFGASEQTEDQVVYVGQAGVRKNGEGILTRLQEHKINPNKDYWTEAIVFTTSNNSFGPTEISYLENRFCALATTANRYIVKNANDPTPGNVTEEKICELEEFIDYAKIIMGVLGHRVFEPFSPTTHSTTIASEHEITLPRFYITRNGTNAICTITTEGVVLKSGSKIRLGIVPTCPDTVKSARAKYKDYIDLNGVTQKDIPFRTPSGASSFVLGSSTNGNTEWKTNEGISLKDFDKA